MRWWERLLRRSRAERQLDAELRDHIEREAAALQARGVAPAEARRRAHLMFGGVDQTKEACRDVSGTRGLETTVQDVRYAWRGLLAQRGFTIVVVLSLALGIGANTAAYTLLHAALFRALPVPEPGQLVRVIATDAAGDSNPNFGYPLYNEYRHALRDHADTFATFDQRLARVTIDGSGVERAVVEAVSGNYFSALRVGAADGRLLLDSDNRIGGGEPVIVISHAYRERRFAPATPVVGRTLRLDERPYTIVGVAAPGFDGIEAQARTDVWVPLTAKLPASWLNNNGSAMYNVMARLHPDASAAQAAALADVPYRQYLEEAYLRSAPPGTTHRLAGRHIHLQPSAAGLASRGNTFRTPMMILMGSVAIILLLCCANVANLLLARQRVREQEFAVRLSLGAGPARLARQLLTESLLLGALGAVIGFAFAYWWSPLVLRLLPTPTIPLALDVTPDAAVFAFTAAISLLSALVVGIVPAWRAAHTDAGLTLTQTTRTVVRPRAGRSLVVVQLAGSLVLLVAALLMARTLHNLRLVDLGFRPQSVLAFDLSFPANTTSGSDATGHDVSRKASATMKAALYQQLTERLSAVPGVATVAYSREPVYAPGGWAGRAAMPDEPGTKPTHMIALLQVGPQFFDALGITRVSGRLFEPDDHRTTRQLIVLNETAARYFFGTRSPIGQRLSMDMGKGGYEVIGVTKDVLHYGAREQPCGGRAAYVPSDAAAPAGFFLVRGTTPAAEIQRVVREELRQAGGNVLLERLRPLDDDVAGMIARESMVGYVAIGLALLAVAIAAVGLYGVLAYGVSQRTAEIGLRAALGAAPTTLTRMVLRDALLLVAIGLVLGLPIAVASVRLLRTLLYGVTATDAVTLTFAAILLAGVAAVAAWLPARRAAAVDPATALRSA